MLKIPPDSTFIAQIIVFVALFLVLRRWWFEPALRVMRERRRRSEGSISEARAIQAEVERLRAEHRAALGETRAEAQREVKGMLRAAEAEQARIVDEATAESQRVLTDVRSRIADEIADARRALNNQVREIAREAARIITGRSV